MSDAWRELLGPINVVSPLRQGDNIVPLLEEVQVLPFQKDLVHKLASDCAAGIPGSAIFMSSARHPNGNVGEPLVLYLKVTPPPGQSSSKSCHFVQRSVIYPLLYSVVLL